MVLPARPAVALALLVALLAPVAMGQTEVPQPSPQTPQQFQCQPPMETCLPDLVATNPQAHESDERFPVKPCADFVNLGDAPTATPFRYLLLLDNVPVAEEQATGAYRTGEGGTVCWGEFHLSAGRHTMEVRVDSGDDVVESNERNNARLISFQVRPEPKVDLRLSRLWVTPTEGGVGMNQIFYVNVSNVGNAPSPLTLVTLEDDHGLLANWTMPPLRPGQWWLAAHATRPEYRPVGTFVARAVVDPLNNLSEMSEDNNEALVEYTVLDHPAPDYEISNVTVSGNRTEMRGVRVDVYVKNVGDRGVEGTMVRLVNATNETVGTGYTRSIIWPGERGLVQFFLVLRAGVHELRAIADYTNIVVERDETNNEHAFTIEIQPAPLLADLPNLVVQRVYAMPEDPRPGEAVSVGALIHNVGTNRSNATRVNFLVNDEVIASASVPALRPDSYYSAYVPWVAANAGSYTIVAVVDQADTVRELDEMDNALALDFLVTTQRAPPATAPTPPTSPPPITGPDPTPTTPTPSTPTTPTPNLPRDTASRVIPGELVIATSPAPGGARGVFSISLRNPTIERVGLLTVAFKIDGKAHKEVLVNGIPGAGIVAASTGEESIPPGKHTVTAEIRVVGSTGPAVVRQGSYEQEAGPSEGIPGFEALGLLGALVAALALARRRR